MATPGGPEQKVLLLAPILSPALTLAGATHPTASRAVVGITSRSSDIFLTWLVTFLREEFREHISEVRYLPINSSNRISWANEMKKCSVGILYHSKHHGPINITDVRGALYNDELQYLNTTLGRGKVLVVLDDMKRSDEEERQRILKLQPSIGRLSAQLVLISESLKHDVALGKRSEFLTVLPLVPTHRHDHYYSSYKGPSPAYHKSLTIQAPPVTPVPQVPQDDETRQACGIISMMQAMIPPHPPSEVIPDPDPPALPDPDPPALAQYQIGIFSQAPKSRYSWLVEGLKVKLKMESVEFRGVKITDDFRAFNEEVTKCRLAILYHSLKEAPISVPDTVYDQELEHLSSALGKSNVIVVVDDLKSKCNKTKDRILRRQPGIAKYARDLFLFTDLQKRPLNLRDMAAIIQRNLQNIQDDDASSDNNPDQHLQAPNSPESDVDYEPEDDTEDVPPTSTSMISSQNSSSCQEPSGKKIIMEINGDNVKESKLDNLSEKLNRNVSITEKVQEKVDRLQLTLQQMLQCMISQDEKRKSQEIRAITEAVKQTLQKALLERDGQQANDEMMRQKLREREEEIWKKWRELQEREEEMRKQSRELQEREEQIRKQSRELQEKEEEMRKQSRELKEREEELAKQERKLQELEAETKKLQEGKAEMEKELQEREKERMKELHNREQQILQRERELQEKEEGIMRQEKTFQDKDEDLMKRERELQDREEKMLLRELQCMAEKPVKRGAKSQETEERTERTGQGDKRKDDHSKESGAQEGQTNRASTRKRSRLSAQE